MRVIAGTARGTTLKTLEGNDIRPTIDLVKEAIFSVIQFDLPGAKVLDLFAGSGQLGIEAISRGASFCHFVDKNRNAVAVIRENLMHCKFAKMGRIDNMDSLDFLDLTPSKFDIALLDPPYREGIIDEVIPMLERIMNQGGIVVCEHENDLDLADDYGFMKLRKKYRYGRICISVFDVGNENEE